MVTGTDLYYDPYDIGIHRNPYPVFRRLREEAPLYHNEVYGFYALSRFADVERGFVDYETFSSQHGGVLEGVTARIKAPKGVFIMADPPVHSAHRGVLSRVFTPRKMAAPSPGSASTAPMSSIRWSGKQDSTSWPSSGRRCPCR